ncbi:MAG: hypothetical protein AAGI44_04180 [Pseudomonadota bacterium]
MNNPRYVPGLLFVIIASSFVTAHLLFKPSGHELIWVQAPHSSPAGGGSINAIPTPASIALDNDDINAAFERETVIRLNAIVRRSLNAVRDYDADINAIRRKHADSLLDEATAEQRAEATANLSKLRAWVQTTSLAVSDMNATVLKLEASDETYNAAILAGMVRFVTTVADEISTEHARISEEHRLALLSASEATTSRGDVFFF